MLLRTSPVARLSGLVAIAIASLFCIGVANWPRNSDQEAIEPLLQPLPQDPKLQVYFNHSQANAYLEPYRQQRRLGDDLEHVVIDTIQQAQASVDIAIQELNLPQIAIALRERQQAGVRVRVLVENTYRQPWSQLTPVEVQQLDQRSRSKYQNFVQLVDQKTNRARSTDCWACCSDRPINPLTLSVQGRPVEVGENCTVTCDCGES